MTGLKPCPVCGGSALVLHIYDTYDRADYGWSAGCGRYKANDGIHAEIMRVDGLRSKAEAIEAWNRRTVAASEV